MPYVASIFYCLDTNYDEFDNFFAHIWAVLSICYVFFSSSAESNPSVYQHIGGRGLWLRPELDLCFVRPTLCFSRPLWYFYAKHCKSSPKHQLLHCFKCLKVLRSLKFYKTCTHITYITNEHTVSMILIQSILQHKNTISPQPQLGYTCMCQ